MTSAEKRRKARRELWKARWILRTSRRERAEMREMLAARAAKARQPWWAERTWRAHFALDPFTMMTLCMRLSEANSTGRPPSALIGIPCLTCRYRWWRARRTAARRAQASDHPSHKKDET